MPGYDDTSLHGMRRAALRRMSASLAGLEPGGTDYIDTLKRAEDAAVATAKRLYDAAREAHAAL